MRKSLNAKIPKTRHTEKSEYGKARIQINQNPERRNPQSQMPESQSCEWVKMSNEPKFRNVKIPKSQNSEKP